MPRIEGFDRARVVEEARSWLGTPYHGHAAVKGAGVDCIRFVQKCFIGAGLVEDFEIPRFPMQWALHQKSELLLEGLARYAREIEGPPKPADVVVFKIGHCWGHSGLVVEWPTIIHANPPGACRYDDCVRNLMLRRLRPRFFSIWGT